MNGLTSLFSEVKGFSNSSIQAGKAEGRARVRCTDATLSSKVAEDFLLSQDAHKLGLSFGAVAFFGSTLYTTGMGKPISGYSHMLLFVSQVLYNDPFIGIIKIECSKMLHTDLE